MSTSNPARRRFLQQIARPDEQLNLAEAALCIAWEDRGHGNPDLALAMLDRFAAEIAPQLADLDHPATIIQRLNSYLFDDLGFRGNTWSYGEPENSFLDHVLQLRAGLPITLSLLYLEVGWRLGLPVVGCALPGHFIVRYNTADNEAIFIDPFHRGRRWSWAECETQIRLFYGNASPDIVAIALAPPTRHAVLARMLRNLKGAYVERSDFQHAFMATERVLLIEPESVTDIRDRGLLHSRLGRIHQALEDFESYARQAPTASDLDTIRHHARRLAEQLGRST